MEDRIKKYLLDVLTAIEEVESFFDNKPKLFDDFYSDLLLRRASSAILRLSVRP